MRLSVTVDRDLLEAAQLLGRARTKSETIEQALREYVQRRRLASLAALEGSDIVEMGPDDIQEWRRKSAPSG